MNDPQFIEAARHLAANAIAASKDPRARIDHITARVLARPFDADEHEMIGRSLQAYREAYAADSKAAESLVSIGESKRDASIPVSELAAWTMVASQILNFDEAITKN